MKIKLLFWHIKTSFRYLILSGLFLVLGFSTFVSGVLFIEATEGEMFQAALGAVPTPDFDLSLKTTTTETLDNHTFVQEELQNQILSYFKSTNLANYVQKIKTRFQYSNLKTIRFNTDRMRISTFPLLIYELNSDLKEQLLVQCETGSVLPQNGEETFVYYPENKTQFSLGDELSLHYRTPDNGLLNLTITGIRRNHFRGETVLSHPILFPFSTESEVVLFVPNLTIFINNVYKFYFSQLNDEKDIKRVKNQILESRIDIDLDTLTKKDGEVLLDLGWDPLIPILSDLISPASDIDIPLYIDYPSKDYIEEALHISGEVRLFQFLIGIPVLGAVILLFNYAIGVLSKPVQQNISVYKRKGISTGQLSLLFLVDGLATILLAISGGFVSGLIFYRLILRPKDLWLFNDPKTLSSAFGLQLLLAGFIVFPLVFWKYKQLTKTSAKAVWEVDLTQQSFWQKHFLDIFSLVLGGVGVLSLGLIITTPAAQNITIFIPFTFFSLLAMIGLFSTLSRIIPVVIDILGRFLSLSKVGTPRIALRFLKTQLRFIVRSIIFISVITALTSSFIIYPSSYNSWLSDDSFYEVGADVVVFYEWHPKSYNDSMLADTSFENSLTNSFSDLVTSISHFVLVQEQLSDPTYYLGIDPPSYIDTVLPSTPDTLRNRHMKLLDDLQTTQSNIPIIVQEGKGYEIGDNVNSYGLSSSLEVVGLFRCWPIPYALLNVDNLRGIVAYNALNELIRSGDSTQFSTRMSGIYLSINSSDVVKLDNFTKLVQNMGYKVARRDITKENKLASPHNQALSYQVQQTLLVLFLITMGFAVVMTVMFLMEQKYLYWLLNSLGFSRNQLIQSVFLQITFILVMGVILGDFVTLLVLFLVRGLFIGQAVPPFEWTFPVEKLLFSHLIVGVWAILETIIVVGLLYKEKRSMNINKWD